jgi:ubiquinone/menaquinone biosynthesis C-methylase UbiE
MAARSLESHGSFVLPWLHEGQRVLDCGCGPGTITLGLSEQVFPGHVTGIDLHAGQIEQAERLAFGLEQVNVSFRTGNIYSLPFEDDSFDLVFSHALFEHLGSPQDALKELRRVLRPDGVIALCSPDWGRFNLEPCPEPVQQAILAYRDLQTRNGGNTSAGAALSGWLQEAGFHLLSEETRLETYESTARIASYLARHLEEDEQPQHARSLQEWSAQTGARFSQAWTAVVGL